jgi:hypothetical protein
VKYTRQLLALGLLMAPLLASAQLGSKVAMLTQVPFEFVVGDKVLPAGKCVVLAANAATETILIRNKDTKTSLFSSTLPSETRETAATDELVFHKYGGTKSSARGSRTFFVCECFAEQRGFSSTM